MSKNLNLIPKTMILMVGPSCCGKSTLAQRLKRHLNSEGYTVAVLSSDDQRRELLLDPTLDNMHPHMMPVSKQAFDLLETKARLHMSFPVLTDFVIIDSTGLDHEMRKQYNILAKEAGYNTQLVAFDFQREELMANVAERKGLEHVSGKHLKTFREKVMPALDRKYWDDVVLVRSNAEATALVPQFNWMGNVAYEAKHIVNEGWDDGASHFAVIGDVHECVEELAELILKLPPDIPLYFIGDMFDKGNNTFGMIDFLIELKSKRRVHMLKGNHENYIARRLTGVIQPNHEIESEYMTAVKPLLANTQYFDLFLSLADTMHPFIQIQRPDGKDVWLTHAPVKNKYIGKHDAHAIKQQINHRFISRDLEEMKKELAFIGEESGRSLPWHVFGHVAHEDARPFMQNNKIWLDTGCVHGNRLSAVVFKGDQLTSITVKSSRPKEEKLFSFKKSFDINDLLVSEVRLSEEEEDQVRRVTKGGCKFISGTMSPAPSVVKDGELLDIESLREGLQYFANAGAKELVLQPKFMGSRCQVYLYKDPEKNFGVSRNGFKVRFNDEFKEFVKTLSAKYDHLFTEELILDGELMPWAALGKGLIEKDFGYYLESIRNDLSILAGDDVARTLTNIPINIDEKMEHLNSFAYQMDLYGSEGRMRYEAFSILSVDGKSWMREDADKVWKMVNDHGVLVIDPTTPEGIKSAQNEFDTLTTDLGYEGIVLKPKKFTPGVLPYMKVRNKNYLRIIYGYDYPDRLEALCRQKNVRKKADVALKEYQMGMAMLETPDHREKLIEAFFGQISKERELDPRL